MAKLLLNLVLSTCRVVGKSVVRTIREEIEDSQRAAEKIKQMKQNELGGNKGDLSVEEACMILNLKKDELNKKDIETRYNHLFKINDKLSFYLQSKIFRAKEKLESEIKKTDTS